MKSSRHLPEATLHELHEAAIRAGLVHSRPALLRGIDARFVASLPVAARPSDQLAVDLDELNRTERLTDGTIPLLTWLENAAQLAHLRLEVEVFERALKTGFGVLPRGAAAPPVPSLAGDWAGSGVRTFLAHAREDERFARELVKHLKPLGDRGKISLWDRRSILPGADFSKEIAARIARAELILILVSADLLASQELRATVITPVLRRAASGGVRVIPILARPSDFWRSELQQFSPLPASGKPITQLSSLDDALHEITGSITDLLAGAGPSRGGPPE